jgi:hypothetical protein
MSCAPHRLARGAGGSRCGCPFVGAAAADVARTTLGSMLRTRRTRHGPLPLVLACAAACRGRGRRCILRSLGLRIALPTMRAFKQPRASSGSGVRRVPFVGGISGMSAAPTAPHSRPRECRMHGWGARVRHGARSGTGTGTVALLPITEPGKRPPAPWRRPGRGPRQGQRSAACAFAAAITPRSLTWLTAASRQGS